MNNSTIKENEIYRGRICRFTHNEVTFEDGSTGYRDVLHLPGAVAVLAKDDEGNIFFVEQFRHAVMESLLELPAGMLAAAMRQTDQMPFRQVLLHGLVRDSSGKKVTSARKNGYDPICECCPWYKTERDLFHSPQAFRENHCSQHAGRLLLLRL